MKDNLFDDTTLGTLSAFTPVDRANLGSVTLAPGGSATAAPYLRSAAPGWGVGRRDKGAYRRFGKRMTDIVLVLITAPMTLPIVMLCAIALWFEGGSPFYRQNRLGKGGKVFSIWKLRTMCRDADAMLESCLAADPALRREWDRTQKLKSDPRITRVGGFLRKTSLDELPQFMNVLRGEMSIVGPRPMMPDQLTLYKSPALYFDMRPGITGEWQVSDRNENSFAHRATVDARYYSRLSLPVDLKILVQTVGVVLRRTGY